MELKVGMQIIKEITTEEYESIIFSYLATNDIDLKDEDIKKIVDLKCKQFESICIENRRLKQQLQQRDDIINKVREFINKYNGSAWYQVSISIISELLELLDNKGKDI